MQRCPKCSRTFEDDSQKFCTFDGGRLVNPDAPTSAMDITAAVRTDTLPPARTTADHTASPAAPPGPDMYKTIAGASPPTTAGFDPAKTIQSQPYVEPTTALTPPPATYSAADLAAPPTPASALRSAPSAPLQNPSASLLPDTGSLSDEPASLSQGQAAPSPAPKRSRLPLILGAAAVLGLLLVGALAIGLYVASKQNLFGANANSTGNAGNITNTNASGTSSDNPGANTAANTSTQASANSTDSDSAASSNANTFAPPPNSEKFVNSRASLSGNLAEHYADFSFYYPKTWQLNTKAGASGGNNFVNVERKASGDFLQESMTVGWYESGGTIETDRAKFPGLVETFSSKFSKNFAEYQKISEGETKVNSLDGYEFRFQSMARNTPRGDITLWGRLIFLPPGTDGQKNGVTLLLLTTSLAPEVQNLSDVGASGELPVILNSFQLGQSQ